MTNNLKIIFDPSDLHIQENLNPKNLKIFFGYDETPSAICDPSWVEVDGDKVDIDCACSKPWVEVDGDQVNLECPELPNKCDPKWKDDNSTDFTCGCVTPWDSDSNDFNVDCSNKTNNSDLGVIRAYQGEYATYSIYGLEIYTAHDGQESSVDLDIRRTIIDNVKFNSSGERLETELTNYRFLSPLVYVGETNTVNLTYSPIAYFEPIINVGNNVDIILNGDSSIDINYNNNAESSTTVLNTYPSISIPVNAYEGQSVSYKLDTTVGFIPNIYDGHNTTVELFLPDTGRIDVNIYEGQNVTTDLGISSSLYINIYDGHDTSIDISTFYEWQIDISQNSEYVKFNFYEPYTFIIEPKVYDGHNTKVVVNTETGFVSNIYTGESVLTTLEYDPYKGYPTEMYSGETMVFQLNNIQEMTDVNVYDGQSVVTQLETQASFRMAVNSYDGQYANVKPMFTVILGNFNAYNGEKLISEIDELPNFISNMGESVAFEIANDYLFESKSYEGQSSNLVLKRGEPVILGKVEITDGQNYLPDVSIMVSTKFTVQYTFGNEMFIDQWTKSPYSIDLDKRKCCTKFFDNILDIELDDAPYNWTRYDYTIPLCELMTFELSSRRTFSFNAYDGQTMVYDNTFNTFSVNVSEGQSVYSRDVVTEHYINLEEGNLIPDGDITIEINRPIIPNGINYIRMYDGQQVNFKLGVPYAVDAKYIDNNGESVSVDLLLNPSLNPRSYQGEYCSTTLNTNIQVPFGVTFGNSMTVRFYEPPILAYDGQYAEFELETKSDYYAEFVSSGCLDNQYTDIGENGQPIPPEFGGANVEGEKFLNYIEGRCF